MKYKTLFTDLHTNLHHEQMEKLEEWYNHAKEVMDFWPIAYYPYYVRKDIDTGMPVEDIHEDSVIQADWKEIKKFVRNINSKNSDFIVFNGYEWQGNGQDGDHNVFFKQDGPLLNPPTYKALYQEFKDSEVIAIPHHVAYSLGHRGKNWATQVDEFSPIVEIYSSHGSSESVIDDIGMERHIHMGPRTGGGTVFDGLKSGNKVGIIASGDNHVVPGQYGHGMAGVLAEDYSKDGIWDALINRRVYGMTKGKVYLNYTIDGNVMGSEFTTSKSELKHNVDVACQNAIDRIVIYKNEIPYKTYNHSEIWMNEDVGKEVKVKFKLEFGWGPNLKTYPGIKEKKWLANITTTGQLLDIEKCWASIGQKIRTFTKNQCELEVTTRKTTQSGKWMGPSPVTTESFVLEIKGNLEDKVTIDVNGKIVVKTIKDLLENTELMVFLEDAYKLAEETYGFNEYYRTDPFYHNAYKVRINQASPERGYKLSKEFTIPFEEDAHYLVKVYERDGSIAWSSPIWINKSEKI